MVQEEISKPKGQKHNKLMLVRYGRMGILGWFEHNESQIPKNKTHVIVKSERGLELGQLVGPYNYRGGAYRSTPEQVEAYFTQGDKEFSLTTGGRFVRFASHEDIREQEHLETSALDEAKCCQTIANELGLNMKIIEAEHLFGGERIIFYFTSEGRVDFRELVKRLAREYQTRIELRQIGSRDEARLISDFESCGLECCCKRFLKTLDPVNMRMAKLQKATLDPSKISGHCGRLKCCLRYEDYTYRELKNNLPHRNTLVQTPKSTGRVVDTQVLTQLVVIQTENGERQAWPLDQIKILKDLPAPDPENQNGSLEDAESSPFKAVEKENSEFPESFPKTDFSSVDEEFAFHEMEGVFEDSRQLRSESVLPTSESSNSQPFNRDDDIRNSEQNRRPQANQPNHFDRDKNRRGRNRQQKPQNDSGHNQSAQRPIPNNSNDSSGSAPA